ncbi:MAG: amidohydrolase, partial [Lysobacterales bacterium]
MPVKTRCLALVLPPVDLCRKTLLATALAWLCAASSAWAQAPQLSAQTQQFVKYAQPLLAITHVRVIDG